MTPLETMTEIHFDLTNGDGSYSRRSPDAQLRAIQKMRNALLALAECDLPDEALDDAEEARIEAIEAYQKRKAEIWANIGKPIPENAKGTAAFTWMPPAFKALLRSIANEGNDNG